MSQFKVREVTPQQSLYGLCCNVTLVTLNRFLPAGISFLTACFLILLMTIANNCLKLLFSFNFFGRAWLWYPANLRLPFRSSLSYIQREINKLHDRIALHHSFNLYVHEVWPLSLCYKAQVWKKSKCQAEKIMITHLIWNN